MSPLALSLRLLQAQPDERLLALASAGHEPAFEALVRRYRRPLLAYCRRLTGPDAGAEDILQQALLQAWRALAAGIQVRDGRAWLYRIVHNVAVSSVRGTGEAPTELGDAVRAIGVEQLVEQRLAAREALAGLAALPALQREVMLETALGGRSHEEVATALGLSNGSVRGLVYRARATLRTAAAALIPGPLLGWATRQGHATGAASAALAGGGSAGVAGAVLKGGAIVTAVGAIAGTAVVAVHPLHRQPTASHTAAHHLPVRQPVITAVNADWSTSGHSPPPAADTSSGAGGSGGSSPARQAAGSVFADHHGGASSGTQSSDGTHSTGSDSRHEHDGGATVSSGDGHHDGSGAGQTARSAEASGDGGDRGGGTTGTAATSTSGTQTTVVPQTATTSDASSGTPAPAAAQPSTESETNTAPRVGG